MPETSFNINWNMLWLVLAFVLVFFGIWRWSRRFPTPKFKFSDVTDLIKHPAGWRTHYQRLPHYLMYGALISFLLAFIDPHFLIPKKGGENFLPPDPLQGIGIYLVLDQSGSMQEKEDFIQPDGSQKKMSKIDLLKQVTSQFIRNRPNDLIGMISFARGAYINSPLTLDHQTILDDINKFDIMRLQDQDGTAVGYAIYKAATIISATRHYAETLQGEGRPAYEIKSTIIILVTDGIQEPSDLDKGKRLRNLSIPDAAAYAKQQGIRLYMINVEPKLSSKEFEPQMRQMQQATESTGGKFYHLQGATSLADIYAAINTLEKSRIPSQEEFYAKLHLPKEKRPDVYAIVSLYPYLIALGLFLLFLAALLNTMFMRRAP